MEFNGKTASQIRAGAFEFIYLSPEVFLNSPPFRDVFYDNKFQDWLAFILIDQATWSTCGGLLIVVKQRTPLRTNNLRIASSFNHCMAILVAS